MTCVNHLYDEDNTSSIHNSLLRAIELFVRLSGPRHTRDMRKIDPLPTGTNITHQSPNVDEIEIAMQKVVEVSNSLLEVGVKILASRTLMEDREVGFPVVSNNTYSHAGHRLSS